MKVIFLKNQGHTYTHTQNILFSHICFIKYLKYYQVAQGRHLVFILDSSQSLSTMSNPLKSHINYVSKNIPAIHLLVSKEVPLKHNETTVTCRHVKVYNLPDNLR